MRAHGRSREYEGWGLLPLPPCFDVAVRNWSPIEKNVLIARVIVWKNNYNSINDGIHFKIESGRHYFSASPRRLLNNYGVLLLVCHFSLMRSGSPCQRECTEQLTSNQIVVETG